MCHAMLSCDTTKLREVPQSSSYHSRQETDRDTLGNDQQAW